jgi:hypothetical protein
MEARAALCRPSSALPWPLLLLLAVGCDGGSSADDDAGTDSDVMSDSDAADDSPVGAPCEMDFDCAEGEACDAGHCRATSPDGYCPQLFERPARKTIIETMGGWTDTGRISAAMCGPRCFVVCVHEQPNPPVVYLRRRVGGATVDSTFTVPFEWARNYYCLDAIEDTEGSVLVAATPEIPAPTDPFILVHRLAGTEATEVKRVFRDELFGTSSSASQFDSFRFQLDEAGTVHLFGNQSNHACYFHLDGSSGFDVTAHICVGPSSELRTADAAVRQDGTGIDLVAAGGYLPSFPANGVYWMDGNAPDPDTAIQIGDPTLGDPYNPQVFQAQDGATMLAVVYAPPAPPFPEPPEDDVGTLRVARLDPAGVVGDHWDLPVPTGIAREGDVAQAHDVLYWLPSEAVVHYPPTGWEQWIVQHVVGTTVEERDLQTETAGPEDSVYTTARKGTYHGLRFEPCGGLRAVLRVFDVMGSHQNAPVYLEW